MLPLPRALDEPDDTVSMLTIQSLGSGSSGNSFLLEHGDTAILLDCGVGIRTIQKSLRERGRTLDKIDAILVTHEHSDHVRTLASFVGREVPIISTAGTRRRADIPPPQWEQIGFASSLAVGEMEVWAIPVSHDAAEPCGFLIESSTGVASIFTDLGIWHDRIGHAIRASNLVVIESNHDEAMLRAGPYPIYLKRRVASDLGHLSNDACATGLVSCLGDGGEREIWLAHLSETNNRPELAEVTTRDTFAQAGLEIPVMALPRRLPGPIWRAAGGAGRAAWAPQPPDKEHLQLQLGSLFR